MAVAVCIVARTNEAKKRNIMLVATEHSNDQSKAKQKHNADDEEEEVVVEDGKEGKNCSCNFQP